MCNACPAPRTSAFPHYLPAQANHPCAPATCPLLSARLLRAAPVCVPHLLHDHGKQHWKPSMGRLLAGASLLAPRTNAGHGKDADRPPPKLPCKPLLPNRVLACSAPPADLHHQGGRLALRLGEHPLQQGGQAASNPFKCPPGMCQAGQLLRVSCASAPQWILHASCPLPVCMADTHACAPCPTCLCRRPAGLVPLWVPAVPSSRSAGRCGAAGMRRQLTTPPAWL